VAALRLPQPANCRVDNTGSTMLRAQHNLPEAVPPSPGPDPSSQQPSASLHSLPAAAAAADDSAAGSAAAAMATDPEPKPEHQPESEPEPEPKPESSACGAPAAWPLRILSIDGGGSKGLVPALILLELERACAPFRVHELFDLVCGTSTGGILALATCVAGRSTREMATMYDARVSEIWKKKGGISLGFKEAKYDASNLEALLKGHSLAVPASQICEVVVGDAVKQAEPNGQQLTHFMIRVRSSDGRSWTVAKHHAEFELMRAELAIEMPGFKASPVYQALPPKTQRSSSPTERRQGLQSFLDQLMSLARTPDGQHPTVTRFLSPQLRMDTVPESLPRVFVVTTLEATGVAANKAVAPFEQRLLRTYTPAKQRLPGSSDCEVWQAARATSAAPTFFEPMDIGGQRYWDGGCMQNNPVKVAMEEADNIWPGRQVGCIVSIGCGRTPVGQLDDSFMGKIGKVRAQITATEPSHLDVVRDFWPSEPPRDPSLGGFAVDPREDRFQNALYLRLNPAIEQGVEMDTTDREDLEMLRVACSVFLQDSGTKAMLAQLQALLAGPCESMRAVAQERSAHQEAREERDRACLATIADENTHLHEVAANGSILVAYGQPHHGQPNKPTAVLGPAVVDGAKLKLRVIAKKNEMRFGIVVRSKYAAVPGQSWFNTKGLETTCASFMCCRQSGCSLQHGSKRIAQYPEQSVSAQSLLTIEFRGAERSGNGTPTLVFEWEDGMQCSLKGVPNSKDLCFAVQYHNTGDAVQWQWDPDWHRHKLMLEAGQGWFVFCRPAHDSKPHIRTSLWQNPGVRGKWVGTKEDHVPSGEIVELMSTPKLGASEGEGLFVKIRRQNGQEGWTKLRNIGPVATQPTYYSAEPEPEVGNFPTSNA
jgi:predicted acylesterase/phospholipase RssA